MTKAVIFSGSHPRHLYVHKEVINIFDDIRVYVMQRQNLIPDFPKDILDRDKNNFNLHFKKRFEVENRTYGDIKVNDIFDPSITKKVIRSELNGEEVCNSVREFNPDVAFIFGTGMIKKPLIDILPNNKINLHLGLSPWFRGSATLFWPFYFLKPQFAGSTFHQITDVPDAGEIIHQCTPKLFRDDGIHDVGAKCVIQAAKDAHKLLTHFCNHGEFNGKVQTVAGKEWRVNDFKPYHLRMIYDLFNDDIVRHYFDGELSQEQPKLFTCLN